jgi:hypothetical protein
MMFWRVFARIQYTIPAHLNFALSVERWSALTQESAKAIEWLDAHEMLYDSWVFVAYSATSCALVQVSVLSPPRHSAMSFVLVLGRAEDGRGWRFCADLWVLFK